MPKVVVNWIGQTLAGRYVVEAQLGEGGMGTVYRARDLVSGKDVAVKRPRIGLLENPQFFKRFHREMKALAQLRHPHLVPVLYVGEHSRIPFIVMKYLTGGNLRQRLNRQPPATQKALLPWLSQIASALDYLHSNGVVHRDVKPDNVLFDEQGVAYLTDFGAVKVQEHSRLEGKTTLTETGTALGTPAYMAPEVLFGKPYDGRADQYALAVMVYEALAGRRPYPGDSLPVLIQAIMQSEVERLDRVCGVPVAVADAVARGLAREPASRFPTCTELAKAVQEGFAVGSQPARMEGKVAQSERAESRAVSPVSPPIAPTIISPPALGNAPVSPTAWPPPGSSIPPTMLVQQLQPKPEPSPVPASAAPTYPTVTPPPSLRADPLPASDPIELLSVPIAARPRELTKQRPRTWPLVCALGLPIVLILLYVLVNFIRNFADTSPLALTGHWGSVNSVAVTPDGQYVVSGSEDRTIRLWYIGDLK